MVVENENFVNSGSLVKLYRRANLIRLLKAYPSKRVFAETTGMNISHVSQLCGGQSKMGDTVARSIEKRLRLTPGSMDIPPTDSPADVVEGDYESMEINPIDLIKMLMTATPSQTRKVAKILGYRINPKILESYRTVGRSEGYDVVAEWIKEQNTRPQKSGA